MILLITGLIFSLQFKPIQNRVGKMAAGFLSRELGAKISIGELYFEPFSSLHIGKLYISDQSGDTILFAPRMEARFDLAQLFAQQKITIYDASLSEASFHLRTDEAGQNNIMFLIDYFSADKADQGTKRKINLDLRRVRLREITFSYLNQKTRVSGSNNSDRTENERQGQIDFGDIHASRISGDFTEIDFKGHLAKASIAGFSLTEKSGFRIARLDATAIVDTGSIELRAMDLQTNRSRIRDYLLLSFADFASFDDFINKVSVQANLDQASIHSDDIAYFAPALRQIFFDVDISGTLSGKVNAIQGRHIDLRTGEDTHLRGDLSITGLPEIEKTVFDLHLDQLSTNSTEIERIVPELDRQSRIDLPPVLDRLGTLSFVGSFYGFYHDFQAKGALKTDLGTISTDLGIRLDTPMPHYKGHLHTDGFDLAALFSPGQGISLTGQTGQDWRPGQIALNATIEGAGLQPDGMYAQWEAQIAHLDFNQYRYRNIDLSGAFRDRELSGKTHIGDPNLHLEMEGSWIFRPDTIAHDLQGQLRYANLHKLHLYRRDSVVIHSADIHSALHGKNLNQLEGTARIGDLSLGLDAKTFRIGQLSLLSEGADKDKRSISIQSDVLNASLSGEVDFYSIGPYMQSIAGHYLPSLALESSKIPPSGRQQFHLDIAIEDFAPVAAFISPALSIAKGTHFSGDFFSLKKENTTTLHQDQLWTTFRLSVPSFHLGSFEAQKIEIKQDAYTEQMDMQVEANQIQYAGLRTVARLQLSQTLRQDTLSYRLRLSDTVGQNHTELSGKINYYKDPSSKDWEVRFSTLPSSLLINEIPWQISASSAILQKGGHTQIHGLSLSHRDQRIRMEGMVSKKAGENLRLHFDNFDLATINPFVQHLNLRFGGTVQGDTRLSSILEKPYAVADLYIDQVSLDGLDLGRLGISADFDQDKDIVNLALDMTKDNKQNLFVGGKYHIGRPGNNLDLLARFDKTDVQVLQVLLKGLVSDVSGSLSGQAQITGNLRQMDFNGTGRLEQVAFKVNYLNTAYRTTGPVSIRNTTFELDRLPLLDQRGQQALVDGRISMQSPTKPVIQANITTNNFMVLHTTARENPLYYGTAYATGRFAFLGTPNDMHIGINARAEEQSIFHIPLNATSNISDHEYIRFVPIVTGESSNSSGSGNRAGAYSGEINSSESTAANSGILEGLRMDMDLQLSPGATTHIYTDLGELSGRGSGQIALRITSLGDFEMFGDYQVNSGKFTFTAQDFINKIFEIKQGGNIRWTGNPTDASINLTAYYEQRTSLSPLYDAAGRTANEQRILTRAEMYLNGNLMRPGITFGLDFPSDPYVKDELQTYLSDPNNVNQQALSLIVRRSFIPGSSTDFGRELNSTLLSAGTELAFNQLNNIISQSLNFNFFDLNIRSFNDASVSLRLFNDRLLFTGGITDLRNQRLNDLNVFSNRIATDAELLYLIRKDGRLMLRGSNRLNTRHFLLAPTDQYISAFGLIYRKDFNTFRWRSSQR